MSSLDTLLSVPALSKLVRQKTPLKDPGPFTKLFMSGGVEPADGDRVIFEKRAYARKLAGIGTIDGEAFANQGPNRKVVEQGMIHITAKRIIHPSDIYITAGIGTFLRSNADSFIADAALELKGQVWRTVEYICSALLNGASGVTLTSGNAAFPTGAVKVANTLSIDGSLQTYALGAPWSTSSTQLVSGGTQLTDAIRQLESNGHDAFHLIHDRTVAKALVGNVEAQKWLTANGGQSVDYFKQAVNAAARRQGESDGDFMMPAVWSGIGGIPSWLCWDHGYENGAGTFTRYQTATQAVLLGSDLGRIFGLAEGPVFVPSNVQVIGDGERAADLFRVQRGMQLYSYRTIDDVGNIVLVCRYTFAPMVRDELGILTLTGVTA